MSTQCLYRHGFRRNAIANRNTTSELRSAAPREKYGEDKSSVSLLTYDNASLIAASCAAYAPDKVKLIAVTARNTTAAGAGDTDVDSCMEFLLLRVIAHDIEKQILQFSFYA